MILIFTSWITTVILFGMNGNNVGKDPIEVLSFHVIGNVPTTTNIMVVSANGSTAVKFKYIIYRGNATMMEYNNVGNSTIVGQANATGALAVGAARYTQTPAYGVAVPTIESFSSVGRTPVNGQVRNKPDLQHPMAETPQYHLWALRWILNQGNRRNTPISLVPAAAHAGGVVALLISGSKKFRALEWAPTR